MLAHSCEHNLLHVLEAEFHFPAVDLQCAAEWFEFLPVPDTIVRKDGRAIAADQQELVFDLYCTALDTTTLGRCLDPRSHHGRRARRIQEWVALCGMLQKELRLPGQQLFGLRSHELAWWACCSVAGQPSFNHEVTRAQLLAWNNWMTMCEFYGGLSPYLYSYDTLVATGSAPAWYPGGIFQIIYNECKRHIYNWRNLIAFARCPLQDLPLHIACHGELDSTIKHLVALRLDGCDMGCTQQSKELSHE